MSIRQTVLNMLGAETQEVQKTSNSVLQSARDFLRYGKRDKLVADWSDLRISDQDMYRGYSYAVLQKRGNKVASLARENLRTYANKETVDEYQARDEEVYHPYLTTIENSTNFSEKQFWKTISIYLDLAGVYYLGVVRSRVNSKSPAFPDFYTDVKEFILLNPYEMRRIVNSDHEVAGYAERKKDGRYREWPLHQIIEIKDLNPFDPEKGTWSMTSAAKESIFTINQAGDYTRQSLAGNIDAPGIITTDLILSDEDFRNFQERVKQHTKGEPLFGNGSGSLHWENMQIDLDKSALNDINEISRQTLFAVSGTSKTSLGIEQSGTTRETARVQSEQFISDTAQPRLEDIIDALNLDYKKHYPREYKLTGYLLEVESAVGRDYDTEIKSTDMRQAQADLAQSLIDKGYTTTSAYQYAQGKIELEDLELEKGLDKPKSPDEGGLGNPNGNSPVTSPEAPESSSGLQDDSDTTSGESNAISRELTPHSDLLENEAEGKKSFPLVDNVCTCTHENKVEDLRNDNKELDELYKGFLKDVNALELEMVEKASRRVTVNAFEESDIVGPRQKKTYLSELKNLLSKYWGGLFLLFGNETVNERNTEFNENQVFRIDNAMQNRIDDNADRVAEGHYQTIAKDILNTANKAYTQVAENAAAELIVKAYKANPDKFSDYFGAEPTKADALASVRKTDILEQNRNIYEKANQMAWEGYNRKDIVKAIKESYPDISKSRATLIAKNETARAYTRSQYEADLQFLRNTGRLENAFKRLVSGRPENEKDKICPFCASLIASTNASPIPFTEPFLPYGATLDVVENDTVKSLIANYESIDAGVCHPNCFCHYELIIKDGVNNALLDKVSNGGKGSGNFGHAGRPGKVGGSASQGYAGEYTFDDYHEIEWDKDLGTLGDSYRGIGTIKVKDGQAYLIERDRYFGEPDEIYATITKIDKQDVRDALEDSLKLTESEREQLETADPVVDETKIDKLKAEQKDIQEQAKLGLSQIDDSNLGYSTSAGMSRRALLEELAGGMSAGRLASTLGISTQVAKSMGTGWHHTRDTYSQTSFISPAGIANLLSEPEGVYKLLGQEKVYQTIIDKRVEELLG